MVLLEIHSAIVPYYYKNVRITHIINFFHWTKIFIAAVREKPINPCQPSPCGPNSQCHEVNFQAVCSCLPSYVGSPPGCRPECTVNSECAQNKACIKQKCSDPCPGTCGLNANCQVINHSPICSCTIKFTGDPFIRCYPIPGIRIMGLNCKDNN